MSLLTEQTVPDLAHAVRHRRIGAVELTQLALDTIQSTDSQLNAVVHLDAEGALATAARIDKQAVDAPDELGSCAGVPTLVKDLNNVRGMPTTFGTRSMEDFTPPFDDETVTRMRRAGFVILGKSNVPEIGTLPVTESLLHGATRNPWNPAMTAGGSSGGAAAAVAAGYVPVAHASDGAGSIRIPASCCGLVGIKPSRGRVSNGPLFGDQVMGLATQGSLGRRVVDAAALLDVMQGYAVGDPYHLPPPQHPYVEEVGQPVGQLRIGLVSETSWAVPDDDVQAAMALAVAQLERLGHRVIPLPLRLSPGLIEQVLDVWSASVAANPLPFDQLEAHNQAFARRGQALGAAQLLQTHTSLQIGARAVIGATATVDAVLAPVLMAPPVPVGAYDGMSHEDLTDALARHLGLTPLINVTGQPAIAIPMHVTDQDLPIGVQLVGHPGGEAALIRLTAQLQEACRWDDWRPPGMENTHT